MNFSQPVNSAILVYSNMEQHKPYLEIRNLSSGKDLWCIVHSSAQRKALFKGFVKNEPRVINTPLKESSLCHKAFLKLFDSSATICTKSIPFFLWRFYWARYLLNIILFNKHDVLLNIIISRQWFSGGGFCPTTPSIPGEHLAMSGHTFITAWVGGCYRNLVGRAQQCCKNAYSKRGNKGFSPKLSTLPILENSALK